MAESQWSDVTKPSTLWSTVATVATGWLGVTRSVTLLAEDGDTLTTEDGDDLLATLLP